MPHDGDFECNYVLEQVIEKHKIKKKDLLVVSLDLSNAFGSFPHWVIFETLRLVGAGEDFINIIKDLYENAVTEYKTSSCRPLVWHPPGSNRVILSVGSSS